MGQTDTLCGEYINNLKYKSHSPEHIDISRPIVKANCANIPKMTWQYQHWDLIWGGERRGGQGYDYTAGSDRSPSPSSACLESQLEPPPPPPPPP